MTCVNQVSIQKTTSLLPRKREVLVGFQCLLKVGFKTSNAKSAVLFLCDNFKVHSSVTIICLEYALQNKRRVDGDDCPSNKIVRECEKNVFPPPPPLIVDPGVTKSLLATAFTWHECNL